ncbi:protein of unknown function [Candidatus Promineifilum breve]|uniref:Uncharacterized protein n=1 Tax=Candidatus Promineifilum breve TaxID=1806508 RepID=A0A160T5R2_9CHLR|nr:protein of unknown function [Candidatus Promineifilum breve]
MSSSRVSLCLVAIVLKLYAITASMSVRAYNPNTNRNPSSTFSISLEGSAPTLSVSAVLSTVRSCDTFTTESRGSPLCFGLTSKFPGELERRRLEVIDSTATVLMALALKVSDWMTSTGRL